MLIHGLLETDFPEGVYVQAYAYDTVFVVSGSQRRELEHVANLALQTVQTWAESVKVRLNAEKCSYMLFPNGSLHGPSTSDHSLRHRKLEKSHRDEASWSHTRPVVYMYATRQVSED